MSEPQQIYKVLFHNQGRVYEIYAHEVGQGGIFGFIEVADIVFGTKTAVVIDPSEDSLRREFQDVQRVHIPMHSIIRIDEVKKEGTGRILESGDTASSVSPFPMPVYTPSTDQEGK